MTYPTEADHFAAIKALLTTAGARPFDYGESIPGLGTTVFSYSILSVTDRFGGVARGGGQIGSRSVRVTVLSVGNTPANARLNRSKVDTALRDQRVTVAGRTSTPIAFETAEPIGQDGDSTTTGNWYSGLSSWTYTV